MPKRNPEAVLDTQKCKWFDSKMDVAKLAEQFKAGDNLTEPHAQWALQHHAKGRACRSVDTDLVYQTPHHALPSWLILLLPKKDKYRWDLDELCDNIRNILLRVLYESYEREEEITEILLRTQNMSLAPLMSSAPALPPPVSRCQTPVPAAPAPSAPETTCQAQVIFGLTTSMTPSQAAARDAPPHLPTDTQPP